MSREEDAFKIQELLGDTNVDPNKDYAFSEKQMVYVSDSGASWPRTNGPLRFETSNIRSSMKLWSQAYLEIPISVSSTDGTALVPVTDFVSFKTSVLDMFNGLNVKVNGVSVLAETDLWHRNHMRLLLEKSSGFASGDGFDELGFAVDKNTYFTDTEACRRCVLAAGNAAPVAADRLDNTNYNEGYRKRAEWLAGQYIETNNDSANISIGNNAQSSHNWRTAGGAYTYTSGNQADDDWGSTPIVSSFSTVIKVPLKYLSDWFQQAPILFNDSLDITIDLSYGSNTNSKINPLQKQIDGSAGNMLLSVRGARIYVPTVKMFEEDAKVLATNVKAGLEYRMQYTRSTLRQTTVDANAATDILVSSSATRPQKLFVSMHAQGSVAPADGHDLHIPTSFIEKSNVRSNGRTIYDEDIAGLRHYDKLKECMPHYESGQANLNYRLYKGMYRGLCAYDLSQHSEKFSQNSSNEVRYTLTNGSVATDIYLTLVEQEVAMVKYSSGSVKVVI